MLKVLENYSYLFDLLKLKKIVITTKIYNKNKLEICLIQKDVLFKINFTKTNINKKIKIQ